MNDNLGEKSEKWKQFSGPNLAYIQEQYLKYKDNPDSVDKKMKAQFEQWGSPLEKNEATPAAADVELQKVAAAIKLIENTRTYGHQAARTNSIMETDNRSLEVLDPQSYQLSENDLKGIPAELVWEFSSDSITNAFEVFQRVKEIYTQAITFEFAHVHDSEERQWLKEKVETDFLSHKLHEHDQKELLFRLLEVEAFEQFLHKTFVAQKRFSLEGLDMLVPIMEKVIESGCEDETEHIMIGMAHRGRLNVLAHALGKPYELIFSEFRDAPNKELVPSEGSIGINYGWTGDVKYHLGAKRNIQKETSEREGHTRIVLAHNPSHLEFVNPVIAGQTRAAQDECDRSGFPEQHHDRAFSIMVHGDAAFSGEGIVSETLNLSRLTGFETGGTIHIIANNQIGFTTDQHDARSTMYASDIAKGYEIPIVRVNADYPEECIAAAILAYQYRKQFNKDILIDLVGYRKHGHNEMDDPVVTQPKMYAKIKSHITAANRYGESLVKNNKISKDEFKTKKEEIISHLKKIYEAMKSQTIEQVHEPEIPETIAQGIEPSVTAVSLNKLTGYNAKLLEWPEDFQVYPKLKRILNRRKDVFEGSESKVDWAHAEALAFSSILADGTSIRMSGQDSERGTFAQRHLVLHDAETNEKLIPLHNINTKATFAVYNSPLSEAAVLGFEYGYSVQAPKSLVIWEAQYGDFVNAAQVIIDQFIAAGRAKWNQKSGLIMLLPHGYEGQGPEHSSARLERFLTLAAENNWTIVNATTAAQYFHILRQQASILNKEEVRPLIMMTPKSLLRNPLIASHPEELTNGKFEKLIESPQSGEIREHVERLILGSGKIMIDIQQALADQNNNHHQLKVVRVEQLYPYPEEELNSILTRYPYLKEVYWVQEEPKNMGAWYYLQGKLQTQVPKGVNLTFIGRPERSSPAAGDPNIHKEEQERIIQNAISNLGEE